MLIRTEPSSLQSGDILIRPKHSGLGFHYGTYVSSIGAVAHTTPEYGKHMGTYDEFAQNRPVRIIRKNRTLDDNLMIEFRAVEDLGKPYHGLNANCEQDVTRVHEGLPRSPSVERGLLGLLAVVVVGVVIDMARN